MSDPNTKLDFSAISFDDVVGDGAPGLDVAEPLESQDVEDSYEEEYEEVENELDEDAEDYEDHGDEDHEDYVDEEYDEDLDY